MRLNDQYISNFIIEGYNDVFFALQKELKMDSYL
jgi:hypothetical protein